MLRFLLVLMTCALPLLAHAATFHADQGITHDVVTAAQFSLKFGHSKAQLKIKRPLKLKQKRVQKWYFDPDIGPLRSEKPMEIWQNRSEKPRFFYFKEFPYQRPFLRPGAGPFTASNDINVVMVPTLSSFVFMLTMMAALIAANQKGYTRKITIRTRPAAFLRWTRIA